MAAGWRKCPNLPVSWPMVLRKLEAITKAEALALSGFVRSGLNNAEGASAPVVRMADCLLPAPNSKNNRSFSDFQSDWQKYKCWTSLTICALDRS